MKWVIYLGLLFYTTAVWSDEMGPTATQNFDDEVEHLKAIREMVSPPPAEKTGGELDGRMSPDATVRGLMDDGAKDETAAGKTKAEILSEETGGATPTEEMETPTEIPTEEWAVGPKEEIPENCPSQNDEAQAEMVRADTLLKEGHLKKALGGYRSINHRFPFSPLAPEALKKRGIIYLRQHRFQSAFNCFQRIVDKYPNYKNFLEILQLEFDTADALMRGKRHYFFGKIPGFKDRGSALRFFQRIVDQAPYSEIAPKALMNIARLGMRIREPEKAIEALERVIDEYANSPLAAEAQLMLAQVRRKMVIGPAYDQRATEEAVNCYREFLVLYPDSPMAPAAEQGLKEARELLAASKLNMGDFYYNKRQNPRAALMYYKEVLSVAPDSPAAEVARHAIERIRSGRRGRGTPLDFFLGRHHGPRTEVDEHGQLDCTEPGGVDPDEIAGDRTDRSPAEASRENLETTEVEP